MDISAQRLSRRLQLTLLAFFLLAALMLVVVYVAAPSIYTNTLSLMPSPTLRSPAAAALLLVAVGVLIALLMIGVLRRWRWVFWLVLMAFSTMILDVPRHHPAARGGSASSVPTLVQPVPNGYLPDCGRHWHLDVPHLSAPRGVGSGKERST
jgi:hypothetical protein